MSRYYLRYYLSSLITKYLTIKRVTIKLILLPPILEGDILNKLIELMHQGSLTFCLISLSIRVAVIFFVS